jgi:predicted Zn-dependent protease
MLERAVIDWGWTKEAIDLLWQIAKFPEKQTDALRALYQHYARQNDTRELYLVLVKLAGATPEDLTVRNNLAQVSLLLNLDTEHARKMAEDLYHREPSNSAYASTYAFALYSKGDVQRAIKIMKSLSPKQLEDPAASAYLGIFLIAAGQKDEAQPYLTRGANAPLLPEEKALLDLSVANAGPH